jgi:hypothetical protein
MIVTLNVLQTPTPTVGASTAKEGGKNVGGYVTFVKK